MATKRSHDRGLPRGGKREGAGRKPLGTEPMRRRTVTLPPAMIARLEQIGHGNLSAGIRYLLEQTA